MDRGLSIARPVAPAWFLTAAPAVRPTAIRRPHLVERLEDAVARHLVVLLQCPSGYGKTTLLAEWVATTDVHVAWLTLTERDGSPGRLQRGVLGSLERAVARTDAEVAAELAHLRALHDRDDALVAAVEVLRSSERPIVLVVDDAHLTTRDAVRQVLTPLVERGGGAVRLVLAAASPIRPWLSRLTSGPLVTLGADALAFTESEVADLLAVQHFDGRTDETAARQRDATELVRVTDGWPVAVGLLLKAGQRPAGTSMVDDALVTEYVTSLLDDLPADRRGFVLTTTAAGRLDAELAEALTGRPDAAEILEESVGAGLFVDRVTMPSGHTMYQWHALFAHHARIVAARESPSEAAGTHAAIARWLQDRSPGEAARHAVAADDDELALAIVRESWVSLLVDGEPDVLDECCAQLPDSVRDRPEVLLVRACARDVLGDRGTAQMLRARAQVREQGSSPEERERAQRVAALAELILADEPAALAAGVSAASSLVERHTLGPRAHLYATFLLGWVELRRRVDPGRAVALLRQAAAEADPLGYDRLAARARQNLRFALVFLGRFREADAVPTQPARGEAWDGYDQNLDLTSRMFADLWRDRLDAVLESREQLDAGQARGYTPLGWVLWALAAAAIGDPTQRTDARQRLEQLPAAGAYGVPWPAYRSLALAHLAAAEGEHADASGYLDAVLAEDHVPMSTALAAELLRRAGEGERATAALAGLARLGSTSLPDPFRISGLRTQAALAWAAGDQPLAHRCLERALALAHAEGVVYPFARPDPVLRDLMASHAGRGTRHEPFLVQCLRREATRAAGGALGLTAREREVLELLRTPMTSEEIATELFVSVATVRTHQRAIYRKLGVANRREAIRLR